MSAPITNEDKAVKRVECADCGAPMKLRETDKYKYGNGKPRKFYGCSRFPDCKGTHGAHPDGKPLGIPADVETKVARNNLHKVMEAIWGNPQKGKRPMYQWLKENAPKEHIGEMTLDEIEKTEALLRLVTRFTTNSIKPQDATGVTPPLE